VSNEPVTDPAMTAPSRDISQNGHDDARPATKVAVTVRDAEIDFNGTTIGPVSMELRRGQLTVITGRSGSGKTTVLSLILGLSQPTRGAVERDIETSGCAPQTAAFADQQSVADNVDLVRALRAQPPADDPASLLGSLGMEGLADRPAGALSGGERQRTALARALSVGADLIVLDEPTSQLDRVTARLISRAIAGAARRGACVVCASHDQDLIAFADQIVDISSTPEAVGLLASSKGSC
jgi:ABC-type multidrug transport system ATPase subunit